MATLEDLKPESIVEGLVVGKPVAIVATTWHGTDTVEVVYRTSGGAVDNRLLSRSDEARLTIASEERHWTLDADGELFKLASEARRIELAHLFDPYVAIESANIDPLPHQIEAVYEQMLPRQPLRFLLADDPGAGKTIMSGLYIRELAIRGDAERVLVVAPGSLVEQWQDELWQRFQLPFDILSRDMVENARTGNPFIERNFLIARVDQIARNEDLQVKLRASEWDLVVVDEAHKMAARYFGSKLEKTKRYQVGEQLRGITRNLLLLTATPHNGKEEDFQQFLALLDPDRFAGRLRDGRAPDASDLMRRYVKENLLTFDGRPLFPERIARTVKYDLSPLEDSLYKAVTHYVREEMDKAKAIEEGGDRRRGLVVGFALTALQRRLASSPEAIYRSVQRRKERLQKRLIELEAILDGTARDSATIPKGLSETDLEDFDFDDYDDVELEQLEDEAIDQATAAATVPELRDEIDKLAKLEKLTAAVRASGTDKKWEELSSILQSDAMNAPDGTKRKIIIFTEHRDTLHYLERRIRSLLGKPEVICVIHGGLRRADRRRTQDAFITNPDIQVLVATDAAGEGVNLQRANLMVNYDLPWNPNRIEQRFGRIHRIGQQEVCHLWNMVAHNTREGAVFERLLDKIEEQRKALGDQVYDVLGDSFIDRSLRELLIEAIRYGDDPEVRARQMRIIDEGIGKRLEDVVAERALAVDILGKARVDEIRDMMERAKARKLQPGFIRAFFLDAFRLLGGRITEREGGRFEITRVPSAVRSTEREAKVGSPLQPVYERVTFEKELIKVDGKPPAELLSPGHPLLTAVIDTIGDRHGALLQRGTVFIDPDDPTETPRALVYLEHAVKDGRPGEDGGRRTVSRRYQFVEIPESSDPSDAGYAPYLDYRPADEERPILSDTLRGEWITAALSTTARSHAIENLAGPHIQEVRRITEDRVARVRAAVVDRLTSEINYWDARAADAKAKELQGKKPKGGFTSGHARNIADDLQARLERRNRQLDQELDLSNQPPTVVGGAIVIPQGLLDRLAGERTQPPHTYAKDVEEVDRRAVSAVLSAERALQREPQEMPHHQPGYDIESRDLESGDLYFIEVKGRIEGSDTVTVKARQVRQAQNTPDRFILALVSVPEDRAADPTVRYLLRPFQGTELPFAAVSVNLSLPKLLSEAVEPR
ncbi:MAG: helicase-related protein [Acidimicrobiia bacterium]|nr:helicase-related protein [Acidimicrobiia bacterium]